MPVDVEQNEVKGTEESLLAELKTHFERQIDLRKNLDNKASTMITVASGISTLIIAIGTFLVSRIEPKNEWVFGLSIGILSLGIIFATLAIWLFVQSYSLRKYRHPMGPVAFFENDDNYKREIVNNFLRASKEKFNRHMIDQYLESMKDFHTNNNQKGSDMRNGQTLLIASVFSISMLLVFILSMLGLGQISIK